MPLGVQVPGSSAVILVGTTSSPTTPIGGLSTWNYVGDAPKTVRDYYGQPSATAIGKKTFSITLTLDYETADAGQLILFNAWTSGNTIWWMLKVDGTNGENVAVKVSHREVAGNDPNIFSPVTFTLDSQSDPVLVATGFGT